MTQSEAPTFALEALFTRLYTQHRPAVARFLLARAPSPEVAEDLTQDVFVKAWDALPRFHPDNERGWLLKIAANVAIDDSRQRALRRGPDWEALVAGQHPALTAPGAAEPEQEAVAAERRVQVATVLQQLPRDYAQALVLADYADLTYPQIAARLGRTRNAIKSVVFRARSQFTLLWPAVTGEPLPPATPLRTRRRETWVKAAPGVYRRPDPGRTNPWIVQPYDYTQRRTVWLGSFATKEEALAALAAWKASEPERRAASPPPTRTQQQWATAAPGVYRRPEPGLTKPWRLQPYDPATHRHVSLGYFATRAQALGALDTWKAARAAEGAAA